MNSNLTQLLGLAEKYGFISAALLKSEKGWTEDEFENRIRDMRRKGVLWVDKKVGKGKGPHYYFLSHLGTDFAKFQQFMQKY